MHSEEGGPLQFPKGGTCVISSEMRVAAQTWTDRDLYDDGRVVMGDRPNCACRIGRSNLERPKPDHRTPSR